MKYIENYLPQFLFPPKYIWKSFRTSLCHKVTRAVKHQLLRETVGHLQALLPVQQQREQQIEQNVHEKQMLNCSYGSPAAQPMCLTLSLHQALSLGMILTQQQLSMLYLYTVGVKTAFQNIITMSVNLLCHFTQLKNLKENQIYNKVSNIFVQYLFLTHKHFQINFKKISQSLEKFLNPFGIISKCLEKMLNLLRNFSNAWKDFQIYSKFFPNIQNIFKTYQDFFPKIGIF